MGRAVKGFLKRANESGAGFKRKHGQKLSKQRAQATLPSRITAFGLKLDKLLLDFQVKHKYNIPVEEVMNTDEFGMDPQAYAENTYLFSDDGTKNANVKTEYDMAEHITVVTGAAGDKQLPLYVIMKGKTGLAPNVGHLQYTKHHDPEVFLAQQNSAFIDNELKFSFVKSLVENDTCSLGDRPGVHVMDGHTSNTSQVRDRFIVRVLSCLCRPTLRCRVRRFFCACGTENDDVFFRFFSPFFRARSPHGEAPVTQSRRIVKAAESTTFLPGNTQPPPL